MTLNNLLLQRTRFSHASTPAADQAPSDPVVIARACINTPDRTICRKRQPIDLHARSAMQRRLSPTDTLIASTADHYRSTVSIPNRNVASWNRRSLRESLNLSRAI